MDVDQRAVGNVVVAKPLERRLDARSAPEFKAAMARLVRDGHARIVLDLSDVEFVDSSGLGAIVSALKQVAGTGDLVLCGTRPAVMSMFKLTRLDKVFQMFALADDAVAALAS